MFQQNNQDTVGRIAEPQINKAKKNKLRILPVSDSPWAPTGFGTNTKNISCILRNQGHAIGYGGCQNQRHATWYTPWPLGQTEKETDIELLPIIYPGQEKFGEKFPEYADDGSPYTLNAIKKLESKLILAKKKIYVWNYGCTMYFTLEKTRKTVLGS